MNDFKTKNFTLIDKGGHWLAQIVITSDGMFASVTDYGNLSYAWRSYGKEDFREFLIGLNTDYFASKLQNGLSYIAHTKKTMESCDRFSEKILPYLQEVLKEDLSTNPKW